MLLLFAMQLGVVLDNALPGAKHAGKGLLQVVGTDQNLVECLLGESPAEEIAPLSVVLPLFLMQLYKIVS